MKKIESILIKQIEFADEEFRHNHPQSYGFNQHGMLWVDTANGSTAFYPISTLRVVIVTHEKAAA